MKKAQWIVLSLFLIFSNAIWAKPIDQPDPRTERGFVGVESFTLIDADNEVELESPFNGRVITTSEIAGRQLTFRANTTGTIGRVVFELTGAMNRTHPEFGAPYALYADAGTDDYFGENFVVGEYQLTATAYTTSSGNTILGSPVTIQFSIVDDSSAVSLPIDFESGQSVSGFTNADQGVIGQVIPNPFNSGINTSALVFEFDKASGAAPESNFFVEFAENLDLSVEKVISFKVRSSQNIILRAQLESLDGGTTLSLDHVVYKTNEWIRMSYDFTPLLGSQSNFRRLRIFPDPNGEAFSDSYYFDDFDQYDAASVFTVDPDFEGYLISEGIDQSGADALVSISDVQSISSLQLAGLPIQSLIGIEYFENLISLDVRGTQFKQVDLSSNTQLQVLQAGSSLLEELDLSANLNLRELHAEDSEFLKKVTLTGLDQLEILNLFYCSLRSIDLSTNTALISVNLSENLKEVRVIQGDESNNLRPSLERVVLPATNTLTNLDLSLNALRDIDLSCVDGPELLNVNLRFNERLDCIQVSDVSDAQARESWTKDEEASYSENCAGVPVSSLDRPIVQIFMENIDRDDLDFDFSLPSGYKAGKENSSFGVNQYDDYFVLIFDVVYPKGVQPSGESLTLSFKAETLSAIYGPESEGGDFVLDRQLSKVPSGFYDSLIENQGGLSATFDVTPVEGERVPGYLVFKNQTSLSATDNPGREIQFTVYDDLGNDYTLAHKNENGQVVFSTFIGYFDDILQQFVYSFKMVNEGGSEGTFDTVSFSLFNFAGTDVGSSGSALSFSEDAEFQIEINPGTGTGDITPAEVSDYSLPDGNKVILPSGETVGRFRIDFPNDSPPDTEKEIITVSARGGDSSETFFLQLPIVILDKDGTFDVTVSPPKEKEVQNSVYRVEEGESFSIALAPEKGAPLNEEYTVEIIPQTGNSGPILNEDFRIVNSLDNNGFATFISGTGQNPTIQIDALTDESFEEEIESFEIQLKPGKILQETNQFDYNFITENSETKSSFISYQVEIVNVVPAGIRPASGRSTVWEQSTADYAEFEIFLADKNTSEKPIVIELALDEMASTAILGATYEFEVAGSRTSKTGDLFVKFNQNEQIKTVRVYPLDDGILNNEDKNVVLQLTDGSGYRLLSDSGLYPNLGVITISKMDPNGDEDSDGVRNSDDQCPDTPADSVVDATGCPVFSLPTNNFRVQSNGESCRGSDDGLISISAVDTSFDYTATLTGGNAPSNGQQFTETTSFTNLQAGNYELCITVDGQVEYEQCFDIVLTEPQALSVFSKVNQDDSKVTLDLEGGEVYYIELNEVFYQTSESQITLELDKTENKLKVSTDKFCQGSFEKTIILSDQILVYPNPIGTEDLSVYVGQVSTEEVRIKLYNSVGTLVSTQSYVPQAGLIRMNLSDYSAGLYLLNVSTNQTLKTFKLIKR